MTPGTPVNYGRIFDAGKPKAPGEHGSSQFCCYPHSEDRRIYGGRHFCLDMDDEL